MRLTFLGTSDAFNSAGRAHSCYWIDDAAGAYTVDFGPTALMRIKQLGRDPDALDAVYLTHLHGDHNGGLAILLVDLQYRARRTRPLVIGGPPGTAERLHQLRASAYPEMLRKGLSFPLRLVTWEVPGQVSTGGREVRAVRAFHDLEGCATSLRITCGERALAFSGDTGWFPGLAEISAGAEVFVCECTDYERGYAEHLSLDVLREVRSALTPKRLVLSHFGERARAAADEVRRLDAVPADDGDVLDLG